MSIARLAIACIVILGTTDQEVRAVPTWAADADSIVSDTFYLGYTYHDHAGRKSRRSIVLDDSERVHVGWVYSPKPTSGVTQGAYYNSVSNGIVEYPSPGCLVGNSSSLHPVEYVSLDVDTTSPVLVRTFDSRSIIQHRHPDTCAWSYYELISTLGVWNPVFSISEQSPTPLYHVVAGAGYGFGEMIALSYWRSPIGPAARRTVLSTDVVDRDITTSPVSLKTAIIVSRSTGIFYFESLDGGLTWGGGPGFGVMHPIGAIQSSTALTAAYDHNDQLHIVFESHIGERGVALNHWSESTGITTAAEASWEYTSIEPQVRTISYPQLGVGVGANLNNLYLVWSQFGTNSDNSDVSFSGRSNADLFLSISTNGGQSWDPARNLTNSSTPGCNGDCWSEINPSFAERVDSSLHIRFVRDLISGVSTSDTLTRTKNPVYYLRVQTPEAVLAPRLSGLPSQIGPLYMKYDLYDTVAISIENPGTATLNFVLRENESWLSFVPPADSVAGSVAPDGPAHVIMLAVDASGFSGGVHQGTMTALSNDPGSDSIDVVVVADLESNVVAQFRFGTSGGTGCWGWTGPDGNEYAFMGTANSVAVIDATRKRVVGTVPAPGPCGSSWREIKTYKHYAYAVSECAGPNEGMMVIDLQYLPDSVHFLGAYAPLSVDLSHNITIDTATGYAYQAGPSTSGIWTRSLLNPESPVHVFSMPNQCHDLFARNDTLWVAEGSGGTFSVWNVSNKTSPQLLARVTIPSAGYVHNIWVSEDGQTAATTEETAGKTVKFWDISDLTDVQLRGQYLGASQLAHNVHLEDNFAVIAHYTSGVSVLDCSNPATPSLIHSVDTYPLSEGPEFAGCWAVYPHTTSGQVYASGMDGYFYIFQFEELMNDCGCPCHGDPACDGTRSDVQDVVGAIDAVFRGGESTQDPNCPLPDVDVDCSGTPDIVDVVKFIDVAFRGVSATTAFCAACP